MADKEMRIKVRVDNSDYTSKMKQMEGAQTRMARHASNTSNTMGGFFKNLISGASGAERGLLGLGKSFLTTSVGVGSLTAAATPMTAALMGAGEAVKVAGRFAVDSIKNYADFEGTLKQVQIIAGGTQADMDMLGDTAIEIGGKTSKGAQEVAEAMVDFAKLGFTAKETSEAMKGIVYAAEASGSSVQETSQIVATALNVWNKDASEAEHVADVLAKTANETAADMQDMGYVLQYAGSSASLAGASLEDLSAMAGIMSDNGIKGSKAGTSLRTAFTNLINPTDAAAGAMESLGVQFKDAEGKARPTMDVIYDLQDAVKGMDDIQIQELSTILFGKPGAAGMSFILKDTKEHVQDLSRALVDSTGTAAKQAAEMRETMAGQLDQLGDSFDAIKLKAGKALTEMFALDQVKGANKILDDVTKGMDDFGKGYQRVNDLMETSGGIVSGTKSANVFADAIREAGTDLTNMPFEASLNDAAAWSFGIGEHSQQMSNALWQLNQNIHEFDFLPADWEGKWTQTSTILKDSVGQMEMKLIEAAAKGKQGGEADISGIMNQTIQENLPALQAAMAEQTAVFGTANQSRLDALQTFFSNEKTLTDEQKSQLMQGELIHGQQMSDTIDANNQKILGLYQSMGQQDFAQRQETGNQINALQEQNSQILQNIAQVESDSVIQTLKAQAGQTGTITQKMADDAIVAANQQYSETVAAATKQYTESVNAINSMSEEEMRAAGVTKDDLIEKARQQMQGTVGHARTQKEQTVGEIQQIADKSEEVDGTHIQIDADADTSSAMENLGALAGRINSVWDSFTSTMGNIKGKLDTVDSHGGLLGWGIEKATGKKVGWAKARGGLTSGVGYGIGGGNAQYAPNATAMGVGTQLGQGGINQGVIHNEKGREVTMPIQNATYMRPFAAAVANELQAMGGGLGGGSVPEIIVPLYVDSREFARATNKAMTEEQQRVKRISNRAVGKK